jgi:hypothetical protein
MSEVDRLSNSGLYPALPIADQRPRPHRDSSRGPPRGDKQPPGPPQADGSTDPATSRPPKSLIDEYA